MIPPRLSVAPMVDWTDRHCRFFHRLIAPRTLLYTEMQTTGAVLRGKPEQILDFDPREGAVALQIAGDSPSDLAAAVRKAEAWPYAEINLNCGCPSDKVQNAHFGACLMAEPALVSDLVKAMKDSTSKPVTVKHRIGIEGHGVRRDSYSEFAEFARACVEAGADRLIVHARIAILEGLDPKQNREIPPLRYEDVYRLAAEVPIPVEINGGIRTLDALRSHRDHVSGVMLGRAAYEDPWFLTVAEQEVFGDPEVPITRRKVLEKMIGYLDECEARGIRASKVTRHMTDLFAGFPGVRQWRQLLSPPYKEFHPMSSIFESGMRLFPDEVLDTTAYRPAPLPKREPSATL